MALTYCMLASGSAGNALWVEGGGVALLIDAGLHFAQLVKRLSDIDRSATDLRAVVVTHGHGDHTAGVSVTTRRTDARILCTRQTFADLRAEPTVALFDELEQASTVTVGGLVVRTQATPHDAPGSFCVTVSDGVSTLGFATDLGCLTPAVEAHLAGCDGLVVELNHDLQMLQDGPYPAHLKRRIASNVGHLSNEDGAALIARLAHPGLQHVTLAHLSETNNLPALAQRAAEAALRDAAVHPRLAIAAQGVVGAPVTLHPGGARGQLRLPIG